MGGGSLAEGRCRAAEPPERDGASSMREDEGFGSTARSLAETRMAVDVLLSQEVRADRIALLRAGAARLRTRYRRCVGGREGAPASGPGGSAARLAQKGAEQSDRARLNMHRQCIAEPPRFEAERREALEAAEQILKIRPEAPRDG